MIKMNMIKLDKKAINTLYSEYMYNDFHHNEVKQKRLILDLIEKENYECYGFYEDKIFRGYAFLCKSNNGKCLLLDYYAICSDSRNQGYGSKILGLLKKNFNEKHAIICEIQNLKFAINEEVEVCNNRIKFYEKNGLRKTNILSKVFSTEYNIMVLDIKEKLKDDEILKELNDIYVNTLGIKIRDESIELRIKD